MNETKIVELTPNLDSRKCFYGKAKMIINNNKQITYLQSYSTIVAEYNHTSNEIKVYGWYSTTTARHINEFLNYYGFDTMNKEEMEKGVSK